MLHLCFDSREDALAAFHAMRMSASVAKVYYAYGTERIEFVNGDTVRFTVKTKFHPALGLYCACLPR